MKSSIKDIFKNLSLYLFSLLFVAFIAIVLTFEQRLSFEKINNLNEQKEVIASLTLLKREDIELALIQFNGKSTHLLFQINKLQTMHKYSFSDRFIFFNEEEYLADLEKLTELTQSFNRAAHEYYDETQTEDAVLEEIAKANLDTAFHDINNHINAMMLKNIAYDQAKFNLAEISIIIFFILVFGATLWYRNRLVKIYNDIEFLSQVEQNKNDYTIFSAEADAIALRMNRKPSSADNPNLLDPVTGINNHKGMTNTYSQKKALNNSNFTAVTVFEIDNFSKSKRAFSQELTQAILKKVAYSISLHEQPVDVIARTDYNQFTLIFSRLSKEQAFKDVDLIRESISELRFPGLEENTNITLSGGFIIKPNNTNLDEAIRQAKEILAYAKKTGSNRVLRTRDIAEKEF